MATMKSYGKIAITNITKVGTLMVTPTCNMPLVVVYNPDTNQYNPLWSEGNKLIIKPVVVFDGTQLEPSSYNVEFKKQYGTDVEQPVSSSVGETVINGELQVSSNRLAGQSSKILTYIMNISYTEPKTKTTLQTSARLTFTLMDNPGSVKYVSITGENVFLYNSNQQIMGSDTITLTAHLTNVSVTGWQYKTSTGTFENYPSANQTSDTLVVKASDGVFTNDSVTIKVLTSDPNTYDVMTIYKVRDGASGGSSISVVLSNDSHLIPCDSDNVPLDYNGAETRIWIYKGTEEVTEYFNITVSTSDNGISYSKSEQDQTYVITNISNNSLNSGYLTFTCVGKSTDQGGQEEFQGKTLVTKFSFTKVKAGVDGSPAVTYQLKPNTYVMNRNASGDLNPTSIVFSLTRRVGGGRPAQYNCWFKIYESNEIADAAEDDSFTQIYPEGQSQTGVESNAHKLLSSQISSTAKTIKCEAYETGSFDPSNLIDSQIVVINKDGDKGENGEDGEGGISVIIGNEAELIACNSDDSVAEKVTITIPYRAYKGIERVAATATIPASLPSGMTNKGITGATTTSDGVITLEVAAGATLDNKKNGEIDINFAVDGVTGSAIIRKFSWSKNPKAADGQNSILFQIYPKNGSDTFINGQGTIVLVTQMYDGASIISPSSSTYTWKKFNGGEYDVIESQTSSELTVTPDMVESMAAFSCTVTHNSKEYTAYFSVFDRTDPYQVEVFSSLGTQLVNPGDIAGAIFTKVYRNGVEEDPIKSHVFSETEPGDPNTNDYYYKITKRQDLQEGTVKLMKYNGSSWDDVNDSEAPSLTYNYYKVDAEEVAVNMDEPWKTGKVIYFDTQDTDPTLNLIVEVVY